MTEKEERILEALQLFSAALENAVQILKQEISKLQHSAAPSGLTEESINLLKWDHGKGERLGEFETAFKSNNMPDNWSHVFNILRANNATLKNHFGSEDWAYYYWLYPEKYNDRIFRKTRSVEKGL